MTIDGETAKDFDDAVLVERRANGNYLLHVHIADVAHYVRPGTALDREARLRGTSVYFPDRAVPMLPLELSNGICSLNPHVDRLVMSALMEIDPQGRIVEYELTPGIIRSAERMTYTAVRDILAGEAAACQRYAGLVPNFKLMEELALILNRHRVQRGSIDFDLPEPLIEFDQLGRMVGITRSERNFAHRLIEEFMLAANEAVAGYLERREIPSLYRIHEKPEAKKVIEFEEIAATFGYSLGVELPPAQRLRTNKRDERDRHARFLERVESKELEITPRHYQRLTKRLEGKPEERILSYLMLRSLKQARYWVRLIQLDPDHLGGRRVELQPHRFAVEVSGLAIPLLALALVHGQLHRAAVGAMERLVDVQHRLHVVFARGDLVEGRTWIAQRGAVDGDAADTFDIRAEHLLRVQFLGDLHPRLAPGVG